MSKSKYKETRTKTVIQLITALTNAGQKKDELKQFEKLLRALKSRNSFTTTPLPIVFCSFSNQGNSLWTKKRAPSNTRWLCDCSFLFLCRARVRVCVKIPLFNQKQHVPSVKGGWNLKTLKNSDFGKRLEDEGRKGKDNHDERKNENENVH